VNPLRDDDLLAMIARHSRDMVRAATRIEEPAAERASAAAARVRWAELDVKATARAIEGLVERAVPDPAEVLASVRAPFEDAIRETILATKRAQGRATPRVEKAGEIKVTFDLQDKRVLEKMRKSTDFYFRDEDGRRRLKLSEKARAIAARGVKQGLDSKTIGRDLSRAMAKQGVYASSESYWRNVASIWMVRARTYGQLRSFQDANVSAYEWRTVGDEIVCPACEFMEGRQFGVDQGVRRIDGKGDVRVRTPFMQSGKTPGGKTVLYIGRGDTRTVVATNGRGWDSYRLERAGLCVPPLHGHCRCVLEPVL
jgi:hypothetical protein